MVLHTPEEFIAMVWMTATIPEHVGIHPGLDLDVIEFFSGKTRIARSAKLRKYRAMAQDLKFDDPSTQQSYEDYKGGVRSSMDINTAAGFTCFG